jgi:SAM-dependent methyltransferase
MHQTDVLPKENIIIPETEDTVVHIYQREIVAENYDRNFMRDFRWSYFEELVSKILTYHFHGDHRQLKVFEGGVGTGLFTIPLVRHILQLDDRSSYVGIDNSYAMLNILRNKPEFRDLLVQGGERVSICYGDLDLPLDSFQTDFNVLIFAGVLHCLNDIHQFFKHIDKILEKDGYLIIAFKNDSYTRFQCGQNFTDLTSDSKYGNFWRYYHLLRESYKIQVDYRYRYIYDVYLLNSLIQIQFNNRYIFYKSYKLPWYSSTTFERMIHTIENGLTFGTGQGVSSEIRHKLGEEMKAWISSNSLEDTNVDIEHQMEVVIWKKLE